jgi:hypothetical protein
VSAVGVVPIRRRYWQCRCGTTEGAYAADALLGLDGRYSRTVQQHACRLAADQSFAAAQEHLREMLEVRVSAETLRTLSESHGQAMRRFQRVDDATATAFRQAEGAVEFTVDAGKVNTREEGWKDLKIGVAGGLGQTTVAAGDHRVGVRDDRDIEGFSPQLAPALAPIGSPFVRVSACVGGRRELDLEIGATGSDRVRADA